MEPSDNGRIVDQSSHCNLGTTPKADEYLQNRQSNKPKESSVESRNPALRMRDHAILDIEPFPEEILEKLNVGEVYRGVEKDGELVVPIIGLYHCVWDGAPIYLEEKSEVWAGTEFGTTVWLQSKPAWDLFDPG